MSIRKKLNRELFTKTHRNFKNISTYYSSIVWIIRIFIKNKRTWKFNLQTFNSILRIIEHIINLCQVNIKIYQLALRGIRRFRVCKSYVINLLHIGWKG